MLTSSTRKSGVPGASLRAKVAPLPWMTSAFDVITIGKPFGP